MRGMAPRGKYSDYLKSTYIKYAFSVVGVAFVLFGAFLVLNLFYTAMQDNRLCNESVGALIAREFRAYEEAIESLAAAPETRAALGPKGPGGPADFYGLLYRYCSLRTIKPVFTLFDSGGRIVATSLYYPNQGPYGSSPRIRECLSLARESARGAYRGTSGVDLEGGQGTAFAFVERVVGGGGAAGFLCLDWKEASLGGALRRGDADIIAVTDSFDNVIYSTSPAILDRMGKCRLAWRGRMTSVDGRPYFGVSRSLPGSGINVLTLSSFSVQRQVSLYAILFSLSVSVLLIFLVLALANKVSANNARFIDELLNAVSECGKGNTGYRIEAETFEEFQTLYDAFNAMLGQLELSAQRNRELAERKRMVEVKHLEGQFNPHFVFNVMETIKYEILSDPPKAAGMVVTLASLMRYSINSGSSQTVALETDVAYVEDYLKLQKARYGRRLGYSFDIPPSLMGCEVPKFLIQPVVENSISHGARDRKRLEVRVAAREDRGALAIEVEDDGKGIGAEDLGAIHASLSDEGAVPDRVGLYNAHRLLRLLYGEPYGLSIASQQEGGTKVVLRMPLIPRGGDA